MGIQRLDENGKVRQEFYEYALQCCNDGIEIWVDIDGQEGFYQISNLCRVKSLVRKYQIYESILNPVISRGYRFVHLTSKTNKNYKIHRLVAIAFIPNPENKREVNHINGVKYDNRVENLEWNTSSENQKHSYKMGLRECKPVKQFSVDGTLICIYNSVREAGLKNGILPTNITRAARVKYACAGGFKWEYA